MPRKSAASSEVTSPSPRSTGLQPPPTLSKPERDLFDAIIENCSASHFRESDLPLLCRYVEASILAERAAEHLRKSPVTADNKPSPWLIVSEKCVRALTALSMRLRLSPQARRGGHALAEPKALTFSDRVRMRNGGNHDDIFDDAESD